MDLRDGALISLLPRSGYLKRSESSASIGSAVEAGEPQALSRLVSDVLLAKQLAKIATLAAGNDVGTAPPASNSYYEALAKEVRARNVAAFIRDGLPRDAIESIRGGSSAS